MTTEELIAEIERLDAAATSGPWKASGAGADSWVFTADGRRFDIGDRLYHPENDANAHLIASYRTLAVEAAKRLRELQASHEAVMSAVATENFEVLQTLGKALGYSPLSDFPEIYGPGEVPLDAVMTWEHTPLTIAEEAARRLKADEMSRAILGGQG